jgi:hypothetical protein
MILLSDDLSIPLDTAMIVRREGLEGQATPDGILTQLEGTLVGDILRSIENRPEPALVDLGFLFLKLSSQAIEDINVGITEITRRTRADGKSHDITLGFSDSGTGITVHCNLIPNALAADKLARHCRLRKYRQRADSWFGLAVYPDNGFPRFGLYLRYAWNQDNAMDEKTKDLPAGRNLPHKGSIFKSIKIGRNEPCLCGSGKKYKKCCWGRN